MTRFAVNVCPPAPAARIEAAVAELDLMLGALPPVARRLTPLLFALLNQGARLYPRCRFRSFRGASDSAARAYLDALLAGRGAGRGVVGRGVVGRGAVSGLAERLKSLVAMCYYELPEVQQEIGYRPGPYIEAVARRRLDRHGVDIKAREHQWTD